MAEGIEPASAGLGTAADEGRHRPPSPAVAGWCEWWSFDACAPDGSVGLFVRLALHPGRRRCSYWAGLVGYRRPYLLVRDDDLEVPPASVGLEVRGSLWAACTCEVPGSHWTLGLESWAVAFSDEDLPDAWGRERGGREGLALDLSFEDEPADGGGPCPIEAGWWRAGRLWGEALVGSGGRHEQLNVEGWPAVRRHCWGPPHSTAWSWSWAPAIGTRLEEQAESLPRNAAGLPTTDGSLLATRWAPVLATEPAGWRVGRALGRSPTGEVGWLESWYPPAERR
ncbi:MAG: hypothetical protein ABIS47_14135 [Acidimicrobiales bacterium]